MPRGRIRGYAIRHYEYILSMILGRRFVTRNVPSVFTVWARSASGHVLGTEMVAPSTATDGRTRFTLEHHPMAERIREERGEVVHLAFG